MARKWTKPLFIASSTSSLGGIVAPTLWCWRARIAHWSLAQGLSLCTASSVALQDVLKDVANLL